MDRKVIPAVRRLMSHTVVMILICQRYAERPVKRGGRFEIVGEHHQ